MANYYCFPPVHTDIDWTAEASVGFWLVTDMEANAPGPGIYTSWASCLHAIEGRPNAEGVFYPTHEATFPAWQARCRTGAHNHPVDPNYRPTSPPTVGVNNLAIPPFVPFSGGLDNVHFAVLGGNITYTTIYPAMAHYLRVAKQSGGAQLLATTDHLKAVFFSLGHEDFAAEQMAAAVEAGSPRGPDLPFTPTRLRTKAVGPLSTPTPRQARQAGPSSSAAAPRAPAVSRALAVPPAPGPSRPPIRSQPVPTTERDRQAASRARLMAIEASLQAGRASGLTSVPQEDFVVENGKGKSKGKKAKGKGKAEPTESDFFDSDLDEEFMQAALLLEAGAFDVDTALAAQVHNTVVSDRADVYDPRFENRAEEA
ncbi:hypothetical protein C8R46DRAFT_1226587 [Mycena filopes]|nr:hypothetical protein C8R46DRAFT_1226587 [Mycena filopes]